MGSTNDRDILEPTPADSSAAVSSILTRQLLNRRRLLAAAAGVSATALLAACGGDDEAPASTATSAPRATQATGGTGAATAAPTSAAPAQSPAAAASPRPSGSPTVGTAAAGRPGGKKIFRIAFSNDVQNMDSAHITTDPDNQAGEAIYNYMARYTYNPPLGTDIYPDLAERYEISPDAKVFTFYINKNAKFHRNYGDCTAEDVKWNWERIQNPETNSRFRTDFLGGTFTVVDTKTIRATFEKSYPAFIGAALGYVSGLIMSKKAFEELGDKWKTNPVGTGPFTWGKYEPGSTLTLDRWPDYWGQKPRVDQIFMQLKADFRAAILAIGRGELDASYIDDPDLAVELLKKTDPNAVFMKADKGTATYWLAFNMNRKPYDDIRVRHALRYAIDQQSIANDLFGGLAEPLHSILPSFIFGFSDDVRKFNYDPNRARQLLREANVPSGLEIDMLGSGTSVNARKIHEAVASYWSDLGLRPKNNLLESAVFLPRRYAGEYDVFGIGVGRNEPDQIATAYWRSGATVNQAYYAGGDDLIDAARAEPDRQKRAGLYKQLQQKIAEDSPAAFIVSTSAHLLLHKRVAGIAGPGWLHRIDWFNVDVPAE